MWKPEPFTMCIFITMHIAMIIGAFYIEFTWSGFWIAWWMYVTRGLAISIAYHRYFSHRAFKTSRWFQFCMALIANLTLQRGPLWWSSWHRHHHIHADTVEDVHSPIQYGFWRAHLTWMSEEESSKTLQDMVQDWNKYPELVWLDKNHANINTAFIVIIFLLDGWSAVYWFVASTVLLWHATGSVNSVCHIWGYRSYDTHDTSRNTWWLTPFTFGECWHNNHHNYPKSAKIGLQSWEVDVSYWMIRLLALLGLVWDVQEPRHLSSSASG